MIVCAGLNHSTSPASLREAVALSPTEAAAVLEALRGRRAPEALLLSTCNRTELYLRGTETAEPLELLSAVLRDLKGVDLGQHPAHTYVSDTGESVRHLFRVTSGLDSMVLGETEIAGQVRAAEDLAARHGVSSKVLRRLVDAAVRCARRVRVETALTEGSLSMASVAVDLAAKALGSLPERRVLIIGSGDTCRLAVESLHQAGVRQFQVCNRTVENARALAARFGGTGHGLDELPELLAQADLVFSSTAAPGALVDAAMVRTALRLRRGLRMVFVDLAMPRDIHPDVNRLPNVFVYSTESVKLIVGDNLQRRREEAPRAERIVDEESARYLAWYRGLALTPIMGGVRSRLELLRTRELARYRARFRPEDLPHVEELTRSLVEHILREPTRRLVQAQEDPARGQELAQAVRHLFAVEDTQLVLPSDDEELPPAPEDPGPAKEPS